MTRVPTTATYNLYLSQMNKQRSAMTDISYQASTGNKYASYDKYGLSTYRLLSLQNERAVTTKYLETNSITQVVLESQQTSLDGIRSALTDIRSQIREFYANDLTAMSKDPSEEELLTLRNVQESAFEAMSLIAYYLNSEVDGNFVFGGGKTTEPPVDFPYTTLEEFQAMYDGDVLTYPTSYSASLSQMSTSAETLGGITIEQEFQTVTPKTTIYNSTATNPMTFSAADNTVTAQPGTFTGLSADSQVIVTGSTAGNNMTLTVDSVSEDGSSVTFKEALNAETDAVNISMETETWKFESLYDKTTGITTNSLKGRAGSFSDLKEGEQILLSGTGANDGYLTIQSISADGSTIVFEETVQNETINTDTLKNGTVKIEQSTQIGKITANSNIGEVIEEFKIASPLAVDTVNNTVTAPPGTFSNILTGGQTITITDALNQEYSLYVKSVSPDGSTLSISSSTPVPNTPINNVPLTVKTRSDIGGFITSSLKGGALQTGDVSFNLNQNSMSAAVKGAFAQYNAGDCLIIKGADSNDKLYIVESVSEDGRTVKFSEQTRIETEMNYHSGSYIANGEGLTICKTYSVGATVEMKGTNNARNGSYTVLGISDDGKEMTVRTESFPEYGATETFVSASFSTDSYYKGGHLTAGYRISETTKVASDVNASAGAFEKIFRALGTIAQGNMLDSDTPENAAKRVSEALDLLDKALTVNPNGKNEDVTSVQYSVITRLDQVKTTIENQTNVQNSLESYISALTQVDKTEAVTMLLQASENLQVSYSVLSTMNQLSLLNYL